MTVSEMFQEKTHINADYLLLEILEFLGLYEDEGAKSTK